MKSVSAALVVIALMTTGCNRPVQVSPEAIADAQLGVRVKTALVNDPQLGTRIIEVRATRGVVTLSGLVGSADEATRAQELARTVPGVSEVKSLLVVRQPSELQAAADSSPPSARLARVTDYASSASRRRRLAVGAALTTTQHAEDTLGSAMTIGPLFRFGSKRGLGVALGFSWFDADLASSAADELGKITVRPVMAGANYTFTNHARWALTASMVAGMAFNSLEFKESRARDGLALEIDNSFAMRPGLSLWYDVNGRVALNAFSGYVVTRPTVTYLDNDQFTRRPLRADAAVFSVGLAYKLF